MAIPAELGQATGHRRRGHEANQIAARRAEDDRPGDVAADEPVESVRSSGIDRQHQPGEQVERDREDATAQPEGATDDEDRERLAGDRDRRRGKLDPEVADDGDRLARLDDRDLSADGDEDGAGDDQGGFPAVLRPGSGRGSRRG